MELEYALMMVKRGYVLESVFYTQNVTAKCLPITTRHGKRMNTTVSA